MCYCKGPFACSWHTRAAVDTSNSDFFFKKNVQLWLKCEKKKKFKILEFSEIFG